MYLKFYYVLIAFLAAVSIGHGFLVRRREITDRMPFPMSSDHRMHQLQAEEIRKEVQPGFGIRNPQAVGRRRRALVMVPSLLELARREMYENEDPGESILLLRLRSPQIWR